MTFHRRLWARVLLVGLVGLSVAARAEIPSPPLVPAGLASGVTSEFDQRRGGLVSALARLNSDIDAQNARCGDVTSDQTALVQSCKESQAKVLKELEGYKAGLRVYEQALTHAVRFKEPPSPYTGAWKVTSVDGAKDFSIRTPGGVMLRGAEAAKVAIENGATLSTGQSAVDLTLDDGSRVRISPHTTLIVERYDHAGGETKSLLIRLKEGVLGWTTGRQASDHDVRFRLPTVVVAVRGTRFEATVRADGSGGVKLYSGLLDLTPNAGGTAIKLRAGQMISFDAAGKITGPVGMR